MSSTQKKHIQPANPVHVKVLAAVFSGNDVTLTRGYTKRRKWFHDTVGEHTVHDVVVEGSYVSVPNIPRTKSRSCRNDSIH